MTSATTRLVGAGAHRGDVGEVLHGGSSAHVLPGRPGAPEVPVLDQHVGGDHEPAVRRGHHRGVVAGRQERVRPRRQEREDPRQERLLGQLRDEGAVAGGHPDTVEGRGRRPGYRGPCATDDSATPAAVVATLALLAGCASAVAADVAPHATDPVCASVVLAMPDSLGDGLPQRDTTAQATTAWGDPEAPIVLRCGVEPLGPDDGALPDRRDARAARASTGSSVENDDDSWTLTTYGRAPAVELHVPGVGGDVDAATSYVDQLGPAVAMTKQAAVLPVAGQRPYCAATGQSNALAVGEADVVEVLDDDPVRRGRSRPRCTSRPAARSTRARPAGRA